MARTLPRGRVIRPKKPHCAATGECCTAASDQHPSTLREEAPAVARSRPTPVGLAVPRLGGLAFVAGHRQARNGSCVARISLRLDVEDPERQARPSGGLTRGSRPHPPHERRKSALGSAAHSRELLKLGINIGEMSVSKYLIRNRKSPSQTWRTFLDNHLRSLVSVDFFTV